MSREPDQKRLRVGDDGSFSKCFICDEATHTAIDCRYNEVAKELCAMAVRFKMTLEDVKSVRESLVKLKEKENAPARKIAVVSDPQGATVWTYNLPYDFPAIKYVGGHMIVTGNPFLPQPPLFSIDRI